MHRKIIVVRHYGMPFADNEHAQLLHTGPLFHYIRIVE
jgi:hypothetical protein